MRPRRLGLVVNPTAGGGREGTLAAAAAALAALAPAEVVTGPGELGEAACLRRRASDPGLAVTVAVPGSATGRAATADLVVRAARSGVDALVVVGGDGTLSDAATALHAAGLSVPVVGVGAGSTNAGALVSVERAAVGDLAADLREETVTALALVLPGGERCLAFNDVVVGDTVCGTVGGRFVNLAAAPFMRGERVLASPTAVRSPAARVTKAGADGREVEVGAGEDVGCVVVGFTRTGDVVGQALLGGLGLSSAAGVPAACLVASFPLVYADMDAATHAAMEPLRTAYVGLSPGEAVRLTGFSGGAALVADGNPLELLEPGDVVEVRVQEAACRVLRPAARVRGEAPDRGEAPRPGGPRGHGEALRP